MAKFIIERNEKGKYHLMIPMSTSGDWLYVSKASQLGDDGFERAEYDDYNEAVAALRPWVDFDQTNDWDPPHGPQAVGAAYPVLDDPNV